MPLVFITGDRSMPAMLAVPSVAIEMLRAYGHGERVMTGGNTGVEQAVAWVAEMTDLELAVLPNVADEDGKPDWAGRTAAMREAGVDRVVVVHGDPMASNLAKPIFTEYGEAVTLVH